jgi:hypothetical protein
MGNILTFDTVKCVSPVNTQPFIWMAEYFSNTGLTEFDFCTLKENNFSDIDKENLRKFGLIGKGTKMLFDCQGGSFNVVGRNFSIELECDGKSYRLNDISNYITDIITYKRAEAIIPYGLQKGGQLKPNISGYFCGYKTKLCINEVNFNFKPIISLVAGKPLYLDISLSVDRDMEGTLYIAKNETRIPYNISLKKNITSRVHWTIM